MRRAQVTLEFFIVFGLASMMLVLMLVVAAYKLEEAADERRLVSGSDVADTIQYELLTASTLTNGYKRTLSLPTKLENKPYTITLLQDGNTSIVTLDSYRFRQSVPTPYCNGTLAPGVNTILKHDDMLWCNP